MLRTTRVRPTTWLPALVTAALLAGAAPAAANVPLTRVSADPFTNASSQHATEVEPDTFASGATVVATYQVGRFFNGGASDIGYARSSDGGATWDVSSFLPGLTFNAGPFANPDSPFERVSDPSVAFDARHGTWMISSIPLEPDLDVPTVFVSRSTDGGATFGEPVRIPPPAVQADQPRQELDGLRQPFREPVLRPLLHRVRQLRRGRPRVHEHLRGRRPELERAGIARRASRRGSAASRSCSPTAP